MSLPTEITLTAQLRTIFARGDFYTIIHRGDSDTGLVILKWRMPQTLSLYTQERDFDDGALKWRKHSDLLDEFAIDAYITRAITRDPDVWVVEIETQTGDFPLEGKVI